MERYDNIVKIEEIRRLTEQNQYIKAAKILDTMDINKIKGLPDLSIIADVLTQSERYKEAMDVLLKIYGKTKTRRVLYQLVELSVKRGDAKEANEYLEKYVKVAPQDFYRYIFRYCIDKLNSEPYEILISSLEQLKEYEYIEVWAYELAKVYHKAGMKDKCVRECSDIVLWFGDGIYVEKAKLLKAYYVGEINPINILKAKEKKEAEKKLELDKTKDYSSMRSQIDEYLAKDESLEDTDHEELALEEGDSQEVNILKMNSQEVINDEINTPKDYTMEVNSQEGHIKEVNNQIVDIQENHTKEVNTQVDYKEVEYPVEEKVVLNIPKDGLIHNTGFSPEETHESYLQRLEILIRGRDITIEKILGYFIQNSFCAEQIITCLENILSDNTKGRHIIITGEKKSGKTALAKRMSKTLFDLNGIATERIAKISAVKFNDLQIDSKIDKLLNSSLIIEEAHLIDDNGISNLLKLLGELKDNIFVILEGNKDCVKRLAQLNSRLMNYFANIIALPNYTTDDLFGFATSYIEEKEYQFTSEVKEAFFHKVKKTTQLVLEEQRLEAVLKLAQKTITAADNRNKKQLADIIKVRNLETGDFLYIIQEDFL